MAGSGYANDTALSPTTMGHFKRSPHDMRVTGTIEGVINTPLELSQDDLKEMRVHERLKGEPYHTPYTRVYSSLRNQRLRSAR